MDEHFSRTSNKEPNHSIGNHMKYKRNFVGFNIDDEEFIRSTHPITKSSTKTTTGSTGATKFER